MHNFALVPFSCFRRVDVPSPSTFVYIRHRINKIDLFLSKQIAVFGKIYHKNLESLIGYCEEPDNLALVYEYMAGSDLKALLSGSDSLSWKTRLQIAIDSAQGLDYLHHGCRPAIIHRDVKTPNILLNQHLLAKIANFSSPRSSQMNIFQFYQHGSLGHLVTLILSKSYTNPIDIS
ncbi:hypothetical protein Cgig2_023802 [Carnegiea gigantea]|uniref:Protein kinase domain-containing protein n=1 Tax=Carnegiea gigantea TaxID=171969 RepID=A0A9Q1GMG5_9CARY|nr:hypothetical protein Cgig2_023802 [Carnegiea gigantea]